MCIKMSTELELYGHRHFAAYCVFWMIFRKIFQAPKIFVPHEQIYVFNMNTIFMQLSQPVDEVKLKLLKVNSVHKSPINFTILPYLIFLFYSHHSKYPFEAICYIFSLFRRALSFTYFAISINFLSHFFYQLAKWVYLLYMHCHDS